MLHFDKETRTIEGVTVFADHAREDLYWYLPPTTPTIAKRGSDDRLQFTLITYRPAAADGGGRGGGFLLLETVLHLEETTERQIRSRLSAEAGQQVKLSPVPLYDGSVRIVALDLEGTGGTTNEPAPPGGFRVTEQILGAKIPAMAGDMNAVFNLGLSQEGAIIMRQAFEEGALPVGVVYEFKYDGLQPALDVKIHANYKRIYDHLSMGIDLTAGAVIAGVPVYLEVGIDLAFEKLKQDGVITIEVINFSTEDDKSDKEQWALDFFKENLLAEWFKPTLPPIPKTTQSPTPSTVSPNPPGPASPNPTTPNPASPDPASPDPATPDPATPDPATPDPATPDPATPDPATPNPASPNPVPPDPATPNPVSPNPGGAVEQPSEAAFEARGRAAIRSGRMETEMAPAVLEQQTENPRGGNAVTMVQTPGETAVVLTFAGEGDPPVVEVNGVPTSLAVNRTLTLEVPTGSAKSFVARYAAPSATTEIFRLFFDFDKPSRHGWRPDPSHAVYSSYLQGQPNPADSAFMMTPGPNGTMGGKTALEAWLAQSSQAVTVQGFASFESDNSAGKQQHNVALSRRRQEVAQGIIGSRVASTALLPNGHARARDNGHVGRATDRVAEITRQLAGGEATVIRGRVSRAGGTQPTPVNPTPTEPPPTGPTPTSPTPTGPTPTEPPPTDPTPATPTPTDPAPTDPTPTRPTLPPGVNPADMGVRLGFKLQKIEQVEDKTITLHYNRQKAVQRVCSPQGLLGGLAEGLSGPPFFIDVDLDAPFFRTVDIIAEVPIEFDRIGLISVDLELEYDGDRAGEIKRKDFRFSRGGITEGQHKFFMNEDLDLGYRHKIQYHFDSLSGWEGSALSYDKPVEATTDRTLLINPHADFGFMEIRVLPGDLDPGMIRESEVTLRYDDGDWQNNKTFSVRPGSAEQLWKLRIDNPDNRSLAFQVRHHLFNGTVIEGEEQQTQNEAVTIQDPFEEPLIIEFFPNIDPGSVKEVFIVVDYEDPDNEYSRREQIRFDGDDQDSQRLRIARFGDGPSNFTFQITQMGTDNSIIRHRPVESEETMVFLSEHLQL